MIKLNPIFIIKNEADIILEILNNAQHFCEYIDVFDNGSTDGSWELMQAKAKQDSKVIIAVYSVEIYRNQFRNRVYDMFYYEFSAPDWWYILDADEMLSEDPRPMLVKAMQRHKNQIRLWQAQFNFSANDLAAYDTEQ